MFQISPIKMMLARNLTKATFQPFLKPLTYNLSIPNQPRKTKINANFQFIFSSIFLPLFLIIISARILINKVKEVYMEKADLSNATKMIDEVLENSSHGIDEVKKAVGDVKEERSKKMKILYIVGASFFALSLLGLLIGVEFFIIFFVISFIICILTYSAISVSISKKFKSRVVNEVVKYAFGEEATYNPIRGYEESDVKSLNLVETGNVYKSSDLILGEYKGVKFSCSNVLTGQETYDSSTQTTDTDIYFQGVIASYEFNKSLEGVVEIREDEAGFGNSLLLSKRNRVEFEDIEFNKQFNVYASDELKAFYIVTPKFIEAFKEIKRRIPGSLIFMVRNDKLFIVINGARNDFEFDMKDAKASENEVIKSLIKELIPFKWFVDILNLDDRFVSNR